VKCALYIDEGVQQVIITPETDFERNMVKTIENKKQDVSIQYGSFYGCQGGWTRLSDFNGKDSGSLMIVLTESNKS